MTDENEQILKEMNATHSVVMENGKCVIFTENYDESLGKVIPTRSSPTDIRTFYRNKLIQTVDKNGKPRYVPKGDWWLDHPQRKQFSEVVFAPNKTTPGKYNLWRGFGVKESSEGSWEKYREHMFNNICGKDQKCYDYLYKWMANCVQNPEQQGKVAVVLTGERGTGKGTFANNFGRLFGQHYLQVTNQTHLTGRFNGHLRDTVFVFVDEGFWQGSKNAESVIKGFVTEDYIIIEQKGVDAGASPNHMSFIIASNDRHVIPAGEHERRFFVLKVSDDHIQDNPYFESIQKEMNNGGLNRMLYDLRRVDLEGFNPHEFPRTAALLEQQIHSMDDISKWWLNKLIRGYILSDDDDWRTEVSREELWNDYIEDMNKRRCQERLSPVQFGNVMKKFLPNGYPKTSRPLCHVQTQDGSYQKKQRYHYVIPDLETCRKTFNKNTGRDIDFSEFDGEDIPPDEIPEF